MERENELILACRKQDQRAQTQLFEMYKNEMRSYIIARMNKTDHVDEIMSLSFQRAFKKIESYTFIGSFGGWLKAIARNYIYDFFDKNVKNIVMYVDDVSDDAFGTDKVVYANSSVNKGEEDMFIVDYMGIIDGALTDKEKAIFLLYYEGYAHKEIAEMFEISVGTSKWYINSAREKLKKEISRQSLLNSN